jgi:hypothetical protein
LVTSFWNLLGKYRPDLCDCVFLVNARSVSIKVSKGKGDSRTAIDKKIRAIAQSLEEAHSGSENSLQQQGSPKQKNCQQQNSRSQKSR